MHPFSVTTSLRDRPESDCVNCSIFLQQHALLFAFWWLYAGSSEAYQGQKYVSFFTPSPLFTLCLLRPFALSPLIFVGDNFFHQVLFIVKPFTSYIFTFTWELKLIFNRDVEFKNWEGKFRLSLEPTPQAQFTLGVLSKYATCKTTSAQNHCPTMDERNFLFPTT